MKSLNFENKVGKKAWRSFKISEENPLKTQANNNFDFNNDA